MFKFTTALALAFMVILGAATAAETQTLPNPLRTAHPGQWVRYRINTLFGHAEQKQTLLKIDGEGDERIFTIKSEMAIDDEHVDERIDNITYEQALSEQESALEDATNISVKNASSEFNGTILDSILVEFHQDDKKCRLLLSEAVPLVGMIRLEIEGMDEPAMELIDFGQN